MTKHRSHRGRRQVMRAAIVRQVVAATGYDKLVVENVLATGFGVILAELLQENDVHIFGFGRFFWKVWKGRTVSYGPRDRRELVEVPDRLYIAFEATEGIREKIARSYGQVKTTLLQRETNDADAESEQADEQNGRGDGEQVADPFARFRATLE